MNRHDGRRRSVSFELAEEPREPGEQDGEREGDLVEGEVDERVHVVRDGELELAEVHAHRTELALQVERALEVALVPLQPLEEPPRDERGHDGEDGHAHEEVLARHPRLRLARDGLGERCWVAMNGGGGGGGEWW